MAIRRLSPPQDMGHGPAVLVFEAELAALEAENARLEAGSTELLHRVVTRERELVDLEARAARLEQALQQIAFGTSVELAGEIAAAALKEDA